MSRSSPDQAAIQRERSLAIKAQPGAVFIIRDGAIGFPEHPNRQPHPSRHVIVAQAHSFCTAVLPRTLLVVPCSASFSGKIRDYHLEIPAGSFGFTKDAVAFVDLVQPALKEDLVQHVGDLDEDALDAFHARLIKILGLADDIGGI